MTTVKTISLYYQDNGSDKVYIVNLVQENGDYQVICNYGRRGNALQDAIKTNKPVDIGTATKIFNKTVNEKKAKGYKRVLIAAATCLAATQKINQAYYC